MIAIVTMLWNDPRYRRGDRYTPAHVHRLASMVDRHLSLPHRHVCYTDDPRGIDGSISVRPIWRRHARLGGCWRKLGLFAPELGTMLGLKRVLYLDLDTVVCGSLDPLVSEPVDLALVACRDHTTPYNTSAILMNAGARPRVWADFTADPVEALRRTALSGMIGDDQAWVSVALGEGERTWTPSDGVLNLERDIEPGGTLPTGARLVYFAGPHDPARPATRKLYPWIEEHWR